VLIYKSTRVLNLAVGEMLMLCAYFFFGMTAALALPVWLAIVLTVIAGGLLGGVIERLLIRPMLGESAISVFMVTVGLSSVLIGLVEFIWGGDPATLPNFLPNKPVFIGNAYVSPKIAVSFVVASILIAAFLVIFRTWRGGVALRATATDQGAAFSCGINVPAVFSLSWVVAGMAAAGSGILIGSIGGISPTMGVFGLSVLVAVIVGGLDSIAGALVAGLAIGVIEALVGTYLGGEYKLLGHIRPPRGRADDPSLRLFGTVKSSVCDAYRRTHETTPGRGPVRHHGAGGAAGRARRRAGRVPVLRRSILALSRLLVAIHIVSTTGLNILTGYTGLVSLGQAAFMAVGAYNGGDPRDPRRHAVFIVKLIAAGAVTAAGRPGVRHPSPCA